MGSVGSAVVKAVVETGRCICYSVTNYLVAGVVWTAFILGSIITSVLVGLLVLVTSPILLCCAPRIVKYNPESLDVILSICEAHMLADIAEVESDTARSVTLSFAHPADSEVRAHVTLQWIHLPNIDVNAPTLLLLHGSTGSSMSFVEILADLSPRYNVYVLDLPGFGRSHVDISFEELVEFFPERIDLLFASVLRFIDFVRLPRVILCGHSFGAFVAVHFALKFPERVSRLVALSPAGLLPTMGPWSMYWAIFFKFGLGHASRSLGKVGLFLGDLAFRSPGAARYWFFLLSHPQCIGDRFVAEYISLSLTHAAWTAPLLPRLGDLRCEVGFVYGEFDTIVHVDEAKLIEQVFDIPTYIVADSGHMLMTRKWATMPVISAINARGRRPRSDSMFRKGSFQYDYSRLPHRSSFVPCIMREYISELHDETRMVHFEHLNRMFRSNGAPRALPI